MIRTRSNSTTAFARLSIISLSSFDTIASTNADRLFTHQKNTNNNRLIYNDRSVARKNSFDRAIDQAVQDFEEILAPCLSSSSLSPNPKSNDEVSRMEKKSSIEAKKRNCEEFLRSLRQPLSSKMRPEESRIDCQKWCEEQNRRIPYSERPRTVPSYRSTVQKPYGSTFYCRKALLQKSNGITYICIRKRTK